MNETIALSPINGRRQSRERGFVAALRAGQCARLIVEGFLRYDAAFRELMRRAPERFAECDWQGSQLDEAERIDLHEQHVESTVAAIHSRCGEQMPTSFWQDTLRHLSLLTEGSPDAELCQTFLCSVVLAVRRTTPGFALPTFPSAFPRARLSAEPAAGLRTFAMRGSLEGVLLPMLKSIPVEAEWADLDESVRQLARALRDRSGASGFAAIDLLDSVFYRFTRAYAVGCLRGSTRQEPLAIELRNGPEGVSIDSILLGETEVSRLVRFTSASFHVDLEHPLETVTCLHGILPWVSKRDLLILVGRPSCNGLYQ